VRLPGIGEDVLFLQFAWHPTIPDTVAITTSQGGVHILQFGLDYKTSLATEDPIILHNLEAWCVAMSPTVSTTEQSDAPAFTIYTGGDDSLLQYATCIVKGKLPQDDTSLDIGLPFPAMGVRGHDAGVTAILPLPGGRDIVVTGSYDDHIRVYSIQPLQETLGLRKTSLLAETDLGGGVWRLRLIKYDRGGQGGEAGPWRAVILASCMHAGARIVQIRGSDDNIGIVELEILGRFEEHKSMNYASDFQPGSEVDGHGELVCVSTSFYDKLLCLWVIKLG
jgi:diphthamide biosynthesis protein 7